MPSIHPKRPLCQKSGLTSHHRCRFPNIKNSSQILEGTLATTGKAMSGPLAELTNREEGPSRAGDTEFVKPSSSGKGNEGGVEDGMMDEDELSRLEAMEASQLLEEAEDKNKEAGDGAERTKRPAEGVSEEGAGDGASSKRQRVPDSEGADDDGSKESSEEGEGRMEAAAAPSRARALLATTDVEVTTTGGRRITFKRRSPDEHAQLEVRRVQAPVHVVPFLDLHRRSALAPDHVHPGQPLQINMRPTFSSELSTKRGTDSRIDDADADTNTDHDGHDDGRL